MNDFPILNGKKIAYLDNGATTQKPSQVINAVSNYYMTENANVHRGIYELAQKSTESYEKAHKTVAEFINAEFEEVIFTKGTTESLNLLAYSLCSELKEGDEIVITQMEHHSNFVPWQQLANQNKLKLKFIPITEDCQLDIDEARKLINKKTKIVSVIHVSNVLGTINPVNELAKIAHDNNALFIVDAAQSVPHMKVDVKAIGCDFLAFSGHKMLAPMGVGILFGKKKLLEKMKPFLYGGDMISEVNFETSTWNDLPWKFEAGTPNVGAAVGLAAAIDYINSIGIEKINKHSNELAEYARQEISKIEGVKIIGPKKNNTPVISFTVEGIHPHDMSEIASRNNVAIRGGHHCAMPLMSVLGINGTTRATFYIYNTKEDADMLVKSIKKAKEIFK